MDLFALNNFSSFLVFFIPGFISLKIYDLIVPNERRDFSKSIFEVTAYSSINLVVFHPLINFITTQDNPNNPYISYFFYIFIFLLMPIIWPSIYLKIRSWKPISNLSINPILKPWDFKFNQKEPAWIIVHLKDGTHIGGVYDTNSFASSYPAEEQIFLETVWELDEKGAFKKNGAINRSKGIIIMKDEIKSVEFFQMEMLS